MAVRSLIVFGPVEKCTLYLFHHEIEKNSFPWTVSLISHESLSSLQIIDRRTREISQIDVLAG